MIMKKLILGSLMAGCLSIGASFADDTKPAGPSAEQKAKLEELKAKLEARRADWKAHHDSLTAEHKAEIEKRIAEHKAEMEKRKAEMDAVKEKVKALIDAYKEKIKAANDSTKATLAKELAAKLKELHASIEIDHKGRFDNERKKVEIDLDQKKEEMEKRLKDRKADFAAHQAEIEAKRAEWLKDHLADHPALTAEQQSELKAKYEEWLAAHANTGIKP
jgi:hypothetical protein